MSTKIRSKSNMKNAMLSELMSYQMITSKGEKEKMAKVHFENFYINSEKLISIISKTING